MDYLQSKSAFKALEMLGFSKKVLIALFIQFMFIFLLIIAFIWFGIQAFSLGGAFGFLSKTVAPAGIIYFFLS